MLVMCCACGMYAHVYAVACSLATVSSTVTSITPLFPVTTAIETDLTVSTSFLSSTEFVVVAVVAGVLLMVLLSGSIAIPAVVCALRRRKYSFMGR